MRPPSVIGYQLDEAQKLLAESGFNISRVELTRSPRKRDTLVHGFHTEMRVVRQKLLSPEEVELVICERTERPFYD